MQITEMLCTAHYVASDKRKNKRASIEQAAD
jgi:hypothetical protein